ncbi:MAG: hypothetical protein DRR42_10300 [Gammaproteobacteria bacterium]|nr:MAG: hypothetical protein DRR42_10300 [Gammaproteobacteria bacterium]
MSYILEALQEAQKDREDGKVPNLHTVHMDPEMSSSVGRKSLGYLSIVAVLVVCGLGISWWINGARQSSPVIGAEYHAVDQIAGSQEHKAIGTELSAASSGSSESMLVNSSPDSQQKNEQSVVTSEVTINVGTRVMDEPSSQQAEAVQEHQSVPVGSAESDRTGQMEQIAVVAPGYPVLDEIMAVPGERQSDGVAGEANTGGIAVEQLAIEGMVVEDKIAEARVVEDGIIEDPIPEDTVIEDTVLENAVKEGTGQKNIAPHSVPHFRTLPVEVQQSLPVIVYSVHLYAPSPAHRMVKIDGLVRRESDTIKPGLILEEITQTGAIFSFGDYIFRVPANG